FSLDGRTIAFESTRGGALGVYVMPALGGEPKLVSADRSAELVEWQGPHRSFVDRLGIDAGDVAGDSAVLSVRALDDAGDSVHIGAVEWRVIDTALAKFAHDDDSLSMRRTLRMLRPGLARVTASVGG